MSSMQHDSPPPFMTSIKGDLIGSILAQYASFDLATTHILRPLRGAFRWFQASVLAQQRGLLAVAQSQQRALLAATLTFCRRLLLTKRGRRAPKEHNNRQGPPSTCHVQTRKYEDSVVADALDEPSCLTT